jgi:hypothetical protein
VSEFIKRGEDAAEVEVTLCSETPGRSLVVWRKIKKDNTSDWKLNGERRPVPRPTCCSRGHGPWTGEERHALGGVNPSQRMGLIVQRVYVYERVAVHLHVSY